MSPLVDLLQALLAPITAVIATYIAYQQYRIRKDEKILALYDRRLDVYKLVIAIVDKVRAGHRIDTQEVMTWENSICEADFIFGDEVTTVLQELFGALFEYAGSVDMTPSDAFSIEVSNAALHIEEYRRPVLEVFTPYLYSVANPRRRKHRLSKNAAMKLLPRQNTKIIADGPNDDIPF